MFERLFIDNAMYVFINNIRIYIKWNKNAASQLHSNENII